MDFGQLICALPLWLLFCVTAATSMLSVEGGAHLAKRVLRHRAKEPEAPLGSLVGSVLGLLAFMLAFTFGMTASRFESRKQLVLDEANAIGTAYLRAGLLPSSQKREIRTLLREYVEVRLHGTVQTIPNVLAHSDRIHDLMWAQAESLVKSDMDSELRTLFVASLNNVIDLHESRLTIALRYRIPGTIWLSLYLLTILSMLAIGYQVGMAGTSRVLGMPLMALAFSIVIIMIADMDKPGEGKFQISHQPLVDTRQMMERHAP
jgi:hypothetical protein